jgi:hypothetical protein
MNYEQIIEFFGSQAEAARKLQVAQPSVWGWKTGIPLERQIDIEIKTEGKLKADLPKSIRKQAA